MVSWTTAMGEMIGLYNAPDLCELSDIIDFCYPEL